MTHYDYEEYLLSESLKSMTAEDLKKLSIELQKDLQHYLQKPQKTNGE